MYLDLTEHRDRFAAYQISSDQLGSYSASKEAEAEGIRQELERKYQLGTQEIQSRLQAARISAGASTSNARLQAQTERAKLKLAREEMEKIGIPDMLIRKFTAEKNYEIARASFGLDIIKTAVDYGSQPDSYFQARQFESAIPGLLNNTLRAPTSDVGIEGPKPNNLADLVSTLTGGQGNAALFGQGASVPGVNGGSGDSGSNLPSTGAPSLTPQDAASAVIGANPPSQFAGLSQSDQSALNSIKAIYEKGLDWRDLNNLNPQQLGSLVSGGKATGYDPKTELWKAAQKAPGQGDARAA